MFPTAFSGPPQPFDDLPQEDLKGDSAPKTEVEKRDMSLLFGRSEQTNKVSEISIPAHVCKSKHRSLRG